MLLVRKGRIRKPRSSSWPDVTSVGRVRTVCEMDSQEGVHDFSVRAVRCVDNALIGQLTVATEATEVLTPRDVWLTNHCALNSTNLFCLYATLGRCSAILLVRINLEAGGNFEKSGEVRFGITCNDARA